MYMKRPRKICVLPTKVNVIHRPFYQDVIHVQPHHTHIVNTKINCHKYVPTFSCSQEFKCKDVWQGQKCGRRW